MSTFLANVFFFFVCGKFSNLFLIFYLLALSNTIFLDSLSRLSSPPDGQDAAGEANPRFLHDQRDQQIDQA